MDLSTLDSLDLPYDKQSPYSSDQGVVNLASLQHPIDFSGIYNGQISADASPLFNMDFDVSFDMRAAVGQEGSTPIMAQDLEAWDAILQDDLFRPVDGQSWWGIPQAHGDDR